MSLPPQKQPQATQETLPENGKGVKSVIWRIQESLKKEAEQSPRTWMSAHGKNPKNSKSLKSEEKKNENNNTVDKVKQEVDIVKVWDTWMRRSQSEYHAIQSKRRSIIQSQKNKDKKSNSPNSEMKKRKDSSFSLNSSPIKMEDPSKISKEYLSFGTASLEHLQKRGNDSFNQSSPKQQRSNYQTPKNLSRSKDGRNPFSSPRQSQMLWGLNKIEEDRARGDYQYMLEFIVNQIEDIRDEIEERSPSQELAILFPSREKLKRLSQVETHPQELCGVLRDFQRYFFKLLNESERMRLEKYNLSDEKLVVIHAAELERLQYQRRQAESEFLIEQLQKKTILLQDKLEFMEKHCVDAITYLSKDNDELVNLIKDKDEVMDKIQDQVELKNEHIRSQDQKLLSVLIYEFKLRKVDIRYQAQMLKVTRLHQADLQQHYKLLEDCQKGFNRIPLDKLRDRLDHLSAYMQALKNDLFHQILAIESKYTKFSDYFNENKKNFHQMNEVQDKIQENQLFEIDNEIQAQPQSIFSKVNSGEQIQNNILLNSHSTRRLHRQKHSISPEKFAKLDQIASEKQEIENKQEGNNALGEDSKQIKQKTLKEKKSIGNNSHFLNESQRRISILKLKPKSNPFMQPSQNNTLNSIKAKNLMIITDEPNANFKPRQTPSAQTKKLQIHLNSQSNDQSAMSSMQSPFFFPGRIQHHPQKKSLNSTKSNSIMTAHSSRNNSHQRSSLIL